MARIQPVPSDRISDELRALLGGGASSPIGAFGVFARRPELALALARMQREVAESSLLSARLRELVRLRIAFHNQCRSCMAVRNGDGVTEDLVCELQAPQSSDELTGQEKAALRYADLLANDHLAATAETFDDLRRFFTEDEIIELCFHVGFSLGIGRVASTWNLVDDLPAHFRQEGTVAPWGSDEVLVRA